MTKADLVEEVSRVSELTKKDAELIVETVFLSVIRALHAGDKVELRGFGSFRLRRRERCAWAYRRATVWSQWSGV